MLVALSDEQQSWQSKLRRSAHQEAKLWRVNIGWTRPQEPGPLEPRWLCMLATVIFLWNQAWCEWVGDPTAFQVVWLSHGNIPFYWAFICAILWRWLSFKLYCLTEEMISYNNSVSLNRIFMIKALKYSKGLQQVDLADKSKIWCCPHPWWSRGCRVQKIRTSKCHTADFFWGVI